MLFSIFERNILLFQFSIFLSFSSNKFRIVRNKQRLILISLFTKLKVVRDIFFQKSSLFFLEENSFISSYKKLQLVFSMRKNFIVKPFKKVYVSKKYGSSYFFQVPDFYDCCYQSLWNFSVLPILDTFSDRLSFGFKPYRNCLDYFFVLKSWFKFMEKKFLWSVNLQINPILFSFSIFKNILIEKNCLKNWLNKNLILGKYFLENSFFIGSIFFSLMNFLFNGLVRINTVLKLNFFVKKISPFYIFSEDFVVKNNIYFKRFLLIRYFNYFFIFGFGTFSILNIKNLFIIFFKNKGIFFNFFDFQINSIFKGVDYFGWNIFLTRKYFLLSEISRDVIRNYKLKIKNIFKYNKSTSLFFLLNLINTEINFWKNIYKFSDFFVEISSEMDLYVYRLFWNLLKRRHPRRPNTWIYSKYWKFSFGTYKFFLFDNKIGRFLFLNTHFDSTCKLYTLPSSLNIYNIYNYDKLNCIWFKKFQYNLHSIYRILWIKQSGLCFFCKRILEYSNVTKFKIIKLNLIKKLSFMSNFVLVHRWCSLS
uniref:RoaA n=1 Tax=Phacus pleuronectes TaxID=102908 RepID=A0A3G3LLT2_9EUGL|nr:RoaA [Phacus pleuronectes]AYQ93667.1 RoaA [Phacus pleuronectes]